MSPRPIRREAGPRCAAHPDAPAGWACRDCGRTLCPECAAQVANESGAELFVCCAHCDGRAEPITVAGSPWTFSQLLVQALRVPLGPWTIAALLALWAMAWFAQSAPEGWTFAVWGLAVAPLVWTIFFAALQAAARGAYDVQSGHSVDLIRDVLLPALNAVVLTLPVGALARAARASHAVSDVTSGQAALAIAVGSLFPSVFITLAARGHLLRALDPRVIVAHVRVLGRDYALSAIVSQVACLVAFEWVVAAQYIRDANFGVYPLLLQLFAISILAVQARLVGLLLSARGGELSPGFQWEQRVPALPGVPPRGHRRPRAAPASHARAPVAPIELSEESPGRGEPSIPGLVRALGDERLDEAVRTYAMLADLPPAALSPPQHLAVGQAAAARGDLATAVRALKVAASFAPDHPDAPRACVILARVYAERLGDVASADKLFRHVVQRYPGTPAAAFAAERLAPKS